MNIQKTSLILHHLLKNDCSYAEIAAGKENRWENFHISDQNIDDAWDELNYFGHQRIFTLPFDDGLFPTALTLLPKAFQPLLIYGMGEVNMLQNPEIVGYFATPPLNESSFEDTQRQLKNQLENNAIICGGAFTGFDSVVHKICSEAKKPSIIINPCGLAHAKYSFRSQAVASLNNGSYMCAIAPMFKKFDDSTQLFASYFQAALCSTLVFCDLKESSPLYEVKTWAKNQGKIIIEL